jgi:hypothetical protein
VKVIVPGWSNDKSVVSIVCVGEVVVRSTIHFMTEEEVNIFESAFFQRDDYIATTVIYSYVTVGSLGGLLFA